MAMRAQQTIHAHAYIRAFVIALLTLGIYALWIYAAQAQGIVETGGSFRCNGDTAEGELFSLSSRCPELTDANGAIDLKHIFSFFVCNVEKLTTELFGNLYCGIIVTLSPAVYAVATMAVFFFGIGFTTGILDFTAKELLGLLMKIALFVAFTTEADYMIGIAFKFFITGAQEGITIILAALYQDQNGNVYPVNSQNLYFFLDNFFYKFLSDISLSAGAEGAANPCKNALFAALGLLAVAFPPIFYMGLLILAKTAMVFVRGVYGYMFSLVGLAFLMVISPIYLSFGLFRQTRPFFDKYIGYLASFSLQMIFVFTFLAFVLSLPLSHVSSSLMSIIVYQKTTYEGNTWRWPWEYCSICEFDIYDINGTPQEQNDDLGPLPADTKVNSATHRLQCKQPIKALEPLALFSPQPDGSGTNPVAANQAIQNRLMDFAMYGLLGLLVLALVIDKLLTLIPHYAHILGAGMGARFAPQIGGGQKIQAGQPIDLPLESGIQGFADGFHTGYTQGDGGGVPRDGITALGLGIAEGAKGIVAGKGNDPGLVGGMLRFMINPQSGTADDN